jgi:hypothetical protein
MIRNVFSYESKFSVSPGGTPIPPNVGVPPWIAISVVCEGLTENVSAPSSPRTLRCSSAAVYRTVRPVVALCTNPPVCGEF